MRQRILALLYAVATVGCTSAASDPMQAARIAPGTLVLQPTFPAVTAAERQPPSSTVGWWRSGGTELVLVPRVIPGQATSGLFGTIPHGAMEGVLSLLPTERTTASGVHIAAAGFSRRAATVALLDDDVLSLSIGGAQPLRFARAGGVNLAALHALAIIGHRALSLERRELDNSLRAIAHSRLFGASGVELDIVVPHDERRRPVTSDLRVIHPPEWRSEITGFDSLPASDARGAPRLAEALRATREASLPFVYLDPKLRWLVRRDRASAASALASIAADVRGHLSSSGTQMVAIGSETSGPGEGADLLIDALRDVPHADGLLQALEITRGTDPALARSRIADSDGRRRPDVLSFNLLRVRGGGGGFLRLFVSSLPEDFELAVAAADQPLIYWTARDERQFQSALAALQRMRGRDSRQAGIITPYPHRLAFFLATREGG